jgi:hypothetical protein
MRFLSGAIAALVIVGAFPSASHASAGHADSVGHVVRAKVAKPRPVDVSNAPVPAVSTAAADAAERADDDAADLVAELPAQRTDDFGLVGVTWTRGFDDAGMSVQVRLRTGDAWSGWQDLDVESDKGEGGRDGTEPLWTGSADGVAVRVTSPTGKKPSDLKVSTIDAGTTTTTAVTTSAATADSDATPASDGSPTYTPEPKIISRAAWGATKNTYCDSPRTGKETRGVIVHHTAGSNSYTAAQSAAIVRATQAYHMKARDWCDIGYNFLVDKYGQIFEGRNGGVDRPVRGAHAGNKTVNTYTMGVSMMGTFTSTEPSDALKSAMVKLIGWRLGTTFHPATGKYSVGGYSLNRIAGHRDVVPTACPGAKAYAWLSAAGGLRDRVAAYISNYSSAIKSRAQELGVAKTGLVYVGEYPFTTGLTGRKARFGMLDMYSTSAGTFEVGGYYRVGYNALNSQTGVLGAPTSEAASTSVSTVKVQRFQHGSIYRVSRGGHAAPYVLWGALDTKYRDIGEASSGLGAPTKSEVAISGGRQRAYFAHGHITVQSNGTVTVIIS